MVKILHAADFHLDSAYGALGDEQARARRQESRELVLRLVDYANEQSAAVMLLSGDLFDSDEFFSQTGEELALALSRFDGKAFIAPGNHDFCASGSAYDRIRDMNRELQARAFVFVRSRVIAVNHLGEKIPDGTKRLEQMPPKVTKLETQNKGAIVSQLEKEGRRYLVIVNRSLTEEMHLTITFEPGVTRILKDGTKVPADKYTDTLWLTPGECEIFEL